MNVIIQERNSSFRSKYDISANDSTYYAEKMFSLIERLQLHSQSQDGRVIAKIRSRFSFFRRRYDFEFFDGGLYRFECEKRLKQVFLCKRGEESFRLYHHKGVRYSIFQDDRQIAAFSKKRVTLGKGNRYEIQVNADANLPVLLCMVLALNTSQSDDNKESVNYDFGNIGPEDRPFDESWKPS